MTPGIHSVERSRRVTVAAIFLAVALCALAMASGVWVLLQERHAALRLVSIDATHLARQVASDAATLALLGDKAAVDANRVAYLSNDDSDRIVVELDIQAALLPGMHSGGVFGPQGELIAASRRFPVMSEAWRLRAVERHRDGWEDMIISPSDETGVPNTIAISRARWNDGRAFEGYSVSMVDLSRLREWSGEQARTAKATVTLMLADGTLLAPLAEGGPSKATDAAVLRRLLDEGRGIRAPGDEGHVDGFLAAGGSVVGVGLARDFPLIGLVEMARDDVLADWRRLRDMFVVGAVGIAMSIALVLGVFVRGERRRSQAEQNLWLSQARLAAALENGNLSLWDWNTVDNKVVFGSHLPLMLGYQPGELPHSIETFKAHLHPDDKSAVLAALQAHVEDEHAHGGVYAIEYRLSRKDGGWTWIADRGRAVERDDHGRALRLIGVHADVTRRKQAEAALREKSRALEDSNRDLEQFAYIASHDLQEPLRMVSSYLSLMIRREGDRLSDQGRAYAATAADGAARMGQLIRDLLEYSRVGTRGEDLTPQDTNAVVAEALDNLSISAEEAAAVVSVQPDAPPVLGDRGQLVRLVQNLVGNALKYRAPDRAPLIDITWTTEGRAGEEMVRVSVRDNGIGIDPADHDRIFQIFQRLHGRDEYEGTGIGLAVCRRIVERHGGRLWVDSAPGGGSAFHASLPRASAPPDPSAEAGKRAMAEG